MPESSATNAASYTTSRDIIRYCGGCEFVDEVETIATRARERLG
jgi:glycine/serine hydroxymethyltransferase